MALEGYRPQSARIVLNTPDTIKLIKLYQEDQVLWNPNCTNHHNKMVRKEKLQAIAKKMENNWTELQVRDKVLSLRSRYSKELVKVRVSFTSGDVYTPVWRFFPLLDSFLQPFCITRKTDTPAVRAFHQRLVQGRIQGNTEPSFSSAGDMVPIQAQRPQYQDISSTKGFSVSYQGEQTSDEDDDLQIIEDGETEDCMDQVGEDFSSESEHAGKRTEVDNSLSLSDLYPSHDTPFDQVSIDSRAINPLVHAASGTVNNTSGCVPKSLVNLSCDDSPFLVLQGNNEVRKNATSVKPVSPLSPPAPPLPSRYSAVSATDGVSFDNSVLETATTLSSLKNARDFGVNPPVHAARGTVNSTDGCMHRGVKRHKSSGHNASSKLAEDYDIEDRMMSVMQKLVATIVEKMHTSEVVDADSAFANHIACELKTLEEDLKADVKLNIQNVIHEAQKIMRTRKEQQERKIAD